MGVASTLLKNGMTDIDQRIRLAAFNWLDEQVSIHGDVLPRSILAQCSGWGRTETTIRNYILIS